MPCEEPPCRLMSVGSRAECRERWRCPVHCFNEKTVGGADEFRRFQQRVPIHSCVRQKRLELGECGRLLRRERARGGDVVESLVEVWQALRGLSTQRSIAGKPQEACPDC